VRVHTKGFELPAPPTTTPPATEPSPPSATELASRPLGGTAPSPVGLAVGASAIFLALMTLGIVALPEDTRARLTAARLGATQAVADAPSVSQVTQRMATAAEEFLERRGRRQSVATALEVAGISLRTGEYAVLVVGATLAAGVVGFVLAGPVGLVFGLVLAPVFAWTVVNALADRRRAQFADLLPDNIQLLTSTLRSGYGLLQALDALGRQAGEPARSEFRRVLLEVRVGRDPSEALWALADRMRSDDFEWVIGAIDINRDVGGGDLALILDNVAETIRERQRLNRQIKSLTAEGRLSGYVLTALPLVLAFAMAIINPDYFDELRSGTGLVLVTVGAALLVVGWLWMRRLSRLTY
jgi:tight adherence protein B